VSVDRIGSERVEVHIATVAESLQGHVRSTVTIAFNCNDTTDAVQTSSSPELSAADHAQGATSPSKQGLAGVNELKFRFKNALVYVNTLQPALPSPPKLPPAPVPIEEEIVFDDDCSLDDEPELIAPPVVAEEPEKPARPTTAVVRIVLRDPTPPPRPVDYDGKATTLQVHSFFAAIF
jgi:hypothetical protein